MSMSPPQRWLLWVARLEGVSFLVLLGIAMPLKYLAGIPLAVRISGAVHGVLFLAFLHALARVASRDGWSRRRTATWLVASVVPLALFFVERDLTARRRAPS
jgi:integral membrane protein